MLAGKFANYTQANKRYIKEIKELTEENQKLKERNERLEKALSERLNFLLESEYFIFNNLKRLEKENDKLRDELNYYNNYHYYKEVNERDDSYKND